MEPRCIIPRTGTTLWRWNAATVLETLSLTGGGDCSACRSWFMPELGSWDGLNTTDVITIDALNSLRRLFFAKLFYPHVGSTEELVCSRLLANP